MPPQTKIAYLLSQYPAVSHTFFLDEIFALRKRGFLIETASINLVSPPVDGFSERELRERSATFYVKSGSKFTLLFKLLTVSIRHPAMVLRGLREVFTLRSWNLHETIYLFFYLAEALLVGSWMKEKNCDHLHVHFGGPVASVALLTSATWGVPYSLMVHGPDEFFDVEKFHLRRKAEHAQFVLCISNFCRSQIQRITPQNQWEKFHVCRLGVDGQRFLPAPAQPSDPARLICVGRLHPSKGQTILLRAVRLLKERGFELRVDLVGGGEQRPVLERLITELGLQEHVTLHGPTSHERTRSLLMGADLFVLPSYAEGIPVALMEAMAMEIACISTFVAGIPELIRSGEDGLLIAPSSVEELSDAIALLVADPDLRRRLARAGRTKVLDRYNQSLNADVLAQILHRYKLG